VRRLHPLYLIATLSQWLGPATTSFDLSTATKLKEDLVFRCAQPNVQWVTRALQSIKSKDLERITLLPSPFIFRTIQEADYQEWWDLDRLLVQFRTSCSNCPKVVYDVGLGEKDLRGYAGSVLPELTRRGLVDVVKCAMFWFETK